LNDLEQMSVAWRRYAVRRQFASVMDTAALDRWMHEAPGLRIDDYLLALDRQGRVRGFLGIWDQRAFKQLRVVGYSRRLAWTRRALTSLAWMAGAAPLPLPGEVLPALATVHACADDPGILRAVLLEAYRRHRGGRHAFLTIGLDGRDPLWAATSGLLAQTTLVHAYVTTPRGSADLAAYHDAPVHHEMALV